MSYDTIEKWSSCIEGFLNFFFNKNENKWTKEGQKAALARDYIKAVFMGSPVLFLLQKMDFREEHPEIKGRACCSSHRFPLFSGQQPEGIGPTGSRKERAQAQVDGLQNDQG